MRKAVFVFAACIILIGTASNTTYVNSETDEGKMHEFYNEADPDGGKHIGVEH